MDIPFVEQYRHPQWQRRKNERLQAANYACESCGSTETTLHIHHRRYFRGRKVWEYTDAELEALCAECHERIHQAREKLKTAVGQLDSWDVERLVGYAKALHMISTTAVYEGGPVGALYRIESLEEGFGVSDAFRVDLDLFVDVVERGDVEISGRFLYDLRKTGGA